MNNFNEMITKIGDKALKWLDDYFDGKEADPGLIKHAIRMVGFNVNLVKMQQIKDHGDKSLAIRLLKFLPDDETRKKYIQMTNPEVKPLLLDRPKKK